MPHAAEAIGCLRPPAGIASGRAADIEHKAVRSLTPTPRAPYLRPSERHPPEAAPEITRAEQASDAACGANALSELNTRGPRVGEEEKKGSFLVKPAHDKTANCSSSSADGTLGRSGPPAHLLGAREIFMAVRNREYSRGGGSVDVPMNLDLVAEVVSLVRSNYDGRPAAGRRRHEITPQGTSCPDLDRARALRCYSGTSIF